MKRCPRLFSVVLALVCAPVWADGEPSGRVTFEKDILPIFQENCQTCHRPMGTNMSGMIAPMSLMSYREVRPWAKAIAKVVTEREMPPWHASAEHRGVFSNERTLSEEAIATIERWVARGAVRGNPADAAEPVEWPDSGWTMGDPDLIVSFGEPFWVGDDVTDLYHNVSVTLTEEQHPEGRWIKELQFQPGSEVVHHIIGYAYSAGDENQASTREGQRLAGCWAATRPARTTNSFLKATA